MEHREKQIAAGKFKATCLRVMDDVSKNKESVIITKRNVPIAKVVPIEEEKPKPVFGCLKGTGEIVGDIIGPIDEAWDVDH